MSGLDLKKEVPGVGQLNSEGLVSFNKTDLDVAELEHRLELAAALPSANCWSDCPNFASCYRDHVWE